jgi:hypothetical protein
MTGRQAAMILDQQAHAAAATLQLPPCPGSTIKSPPGMGTLWPGLYEDRSGCKVQAEIGSNKMTVEEAKKRSPDACDEMIDASQAHEAHHLEKCHATPKGTSLTFEESMTNEVEGYTIEIHALRNAMAGVGQACTPSPAKRKDFFKKAKAAVLSALDHQTSPPPPKTPSTPKAPAATKKGGR